MRDGNDNELAKAAAAGSRDAFARLVERHYDRIYRLAWRWTGKAESAEDIAQDVCVRLADAIGTFRGEAQFSTWLYRVAYAITVDRMRAGQRFFSLPPSEMAALVDAAAIAVPEEPVEGRDLWQAVRSLPDKQRDAVLLVYAEELTHQEAASVMGCSEKTVSWHLHEARKRLRIRLEAIG